MDELKFKKTKIIARQILLYFIDFNRVVLPYFDKKKIYRIPMKMYDKFRLKDKERFRRELYRLKQQGFVKKYLAGKSDYLELTQKGQKLIKKYLIEGLEIRAPQKWDKKWRIVIFDIPNDKRKMRDVLRNKLQTIGFFELQESVYVFPFDCQNEISFLKNMYFLRPYIQYIVADRIETETDLIKMFLDRGLLSEKLLN